MRKGKKKVKEMGKKTKIETELHKKKMGRKRGRYKD